MKTSLAIKKGNAAVAAVVVLVAAAYFPIIKLKALPAKHAAADAQLLEVQAIAAQAHALQVKAKDASAVARISPEAVMQAFGPNANVAQSDPETVRVELRGIDAQKLLTGLDAVRRDTLAVATNADVEIQTTSLNVTLEFPKGQ